MTGTKPAFDDECAFAISTRKRGVDGSAAHQISEDGKTYYFKNGAARFLWKVLPNRAPKARKVWMT